MTIVFIGAGNVATHLATELYRKSFNIVQVYSRTQESASELAYKVEAEAITDIRSVRDDADLYIYSIKDSILEDIISQTPKHNGIALHTAGSVPMQVFSKYSLNYGVLYPFQTFSKNQKIDWRDIPLFIEASNKSNLEIIKKVASTLSTKVSELDSNDRKYIHLTGVFACNFTNHMYVLSELFLNKINLPFDIALPLINETASKVNKLSPTEAQTGPAIRFDENVINKHLSLIEDDDIKEIYKLMSKNIHKFNQKL